MGVGDKTALEAGAQERSWLAEGLLCEQVLVHFLPVCVDRFGKGGAHEENIRVYANPSVPSASAASAAGTFVPPTPTQVCFFILNGNPVGS